jgi:hypothetical protein
MANCGSGCCDRAWPEGSDATAWPAGLGSRPQLQGLSPSLSADPAAGVRLGAPSWPGYSPAPPYTHHAIDVMVWPIAAPGAAHSNAARPAERPTRLQPRRRPTLAALSCAQHPSPLQLASGNLVCAGATGSPPDGAMFLFKDTSQQDIEAFVQVRQRIERGNRVAVTMRKQIIGFKHVPPSVCGGCCRLRRGCAMSALLLRDHPHPAPCRPPQADPYFKNGLVTSYNVSPYIVVVGAP